MCFSSGSTPEVKATPQPPSKMDESAAARAAQVELIRKQQSGGQQGTIGTSSTGLTSNATTVSKSALGS